MIKLSNRLQAVASFVPLGSKIVDVGTDHGYIPIWLIHQGIAIHGIAMDVRKGPLLRAAAHIQEHHLEAQIETRLSDGLESLTWGEADTVIIAGMGGDLMLRILQKGAHVRDSIKTWVFSPQSEIGAFRHGLETLGLIIEKEIMVLEDGKYYTIMLATKGMMHYQYEYEYSYGKELIQGQSVVLKAYLEKEKQQLLQIQHQLKLQHSYEISQRMMEVEAALLQIKEAFDAMQ